MQFAYSKCGLIRDLIVQYSQQLIIFENISLLHEFLKIIYNLFKLKMCGFIHLIDNRAFECSLLQKLISFRYSVIQGQGQGKLLEGAKISWLGSPGSSNDCNHGCWDLWLQLLCVVTLTFKLPQLWHQIWKEKNKLFFMQDLEYVESLLEPDQFVINTWIYCSKFWCRRVHRFPNLAAQCHANKASFGKKFTLKWKMWMLNSE